MNECRSLPIPLDELVDALAEPEVHNLRVFLDALEARLLEVAADLVDYCRGDAEGADLQLCDSHDLPLAQAIAEEEEAAATGYDVDGLPVEPAERRFHEVIREPAGMAPDAAREAAVLWMAERGFVAPGAF